MNIIKKINQTRTILKKYLEDEWHVETIQDYSDEEIDMLYNSNNSFIQFGNASGVILLYSTKNMIGINYMLYTIIFPN